MQRFLIAALGLALSAQTAQAQLFTDNFNSENGGNSSLNYNRFANWTVQGQVDLVRSGDFGITCFGTCVDLDGSSGPGALVSKRSYAFNSGDMLTFSFDVSGNQRGGSSDELFLALEFGQGASLASYTGTGGFSSYSNSVPGGFTLGSIAFGQTIAPSDPFSTWSMSFVAAGAGSLYYVLSTNSRDNVGPIVDNIVIDQTSTTVPEPSTWALMAAGLGAMALVARRRTRA